MLAIENTSGYTYTGISQASTTQALAKVLAVTNAAVFLAFDASRVTSGTHASPAVTPGRSTTLAPGTGSFRALQVQLQLIFFPCSPSE